MIKHLIFWSHNRAMRILNAPKYEFFELGLKCLLEAQNFCNLAVFLFLVAKWISCTAYVVEVMLITAVDKFLFC